MRIDTRRPATQALSDPVVRYRNKGVLKVAVTDPLPNSGCAIVTIKVTTSKGKLLHAISLGQQPIDTVIKIPFAWTMKAGRYRYKVLATDLAGNPQGKIGRGVIRVR